MTTRKPNRKKRQNRRKQYDPYANLPSGERRALALGVFIEKVHRRRLLSMHDGKCGICHQLVNPKKFEIDHVIPLSKGGTHEYANCQPAHTDCNRLKADKMPDEVVIPWRRKSLRSKGYINPPRMGRAAA